MPVPEEVNFAYHLASNEPGVRRRALSKLMKWIRVKSAHVKTAFTEEAMMKLWKGLFFCMWMADKPLVQQDVADSISSLVHSFSCEEQTFMFIDAFYKTMAHEWFAIDRFRLDKFMMLVRRFFRQSLVFVHKGGWKEECIQSFNACLSKTVFDPTSDDVPAGLKTHIVDIFLQELARVQGCKLTGEQSLLFLEPFFRILVESPLKVLRHSVRDNIFHLMIDLDPATTGEAVGEEFEEVDEEQDDDKTDSGSEEEDNYESFSMAKSETQVDLPAVPFDYEMIANRFIECSKLKEMKSPNRCMIANLVKKFWDLSRGVNPRLIIDEDSGSDLEIMENDITKAAKMLKEEEERELMMEKEELKRLAAASVKAKKGGKFGLDTCSGVYEHMTAAESSESGSDADTESADEEPKIVQPKKKLKQSAKQRSLGKQSIKDGDESCDLDEKSLPVANGMRNDVEVAQQKKRRKKKRPTANKEHSDDAYYDELMKHENQYLSDTSALRSGEEKTEDGETRKESKKRKKGTKVSSGSESSSMPPKRKKKKVKLAVGNELLKEQGMPGDKSTPGPKAGKKKKKNPASPSGSVPAALDKAGTKTGSVEDVVLSEVVPSSEVHNVAKAVTCDSNNVTKRKFTGNQNVTKRKKMKGKCTRLPTAQSNVTASLASESPAGQDGLQVQKNGKKKRKSLLDLKNSENSLTLFEVKQNVRLLEDDSRSPLKEAQKPAGTTLQSTDLSPRITSAEAQRDSTSSLLKRGLGSRGKVSKEARAIGQVTKLGQENTDVGAKLSPQKGQVVKKSKFAQFALSTPTAKFLKQSHLRAQTERPKPKGKAALKRQSLSDPLSSGKKVNFLLSRNRAQDPREYLESLKASPQIPFDASKKPAQGVLKVKEPSIQETPFKPTASCKRRRASDFF